MLKEKVFLLVRDSNLPVKPKDYRKFLDEGTDLVAELQTENPQITPEELQVKLDKYIESKKGGDNSTVFEKYPTDTKKLKQLIKQIGFPITFALVNGSLIGVVNDCNTSDQEAF